MNSADAKRDEMTIADVMIAGEIEMIAEMVRKRKVWMMFMLQSSLDLKEGQSVIIQGEGRGTTATGLGTSRGVR